jgi:hypothetical protein
MGNYKDIEKDFIERTIQLIGQYYDNLGQYAFEEQFNYTLTINCLLGLIVMPKERVITFVSNKRLTSQYKEQIGLPTSEIGEGIKTLRDLIYQLRHAVAHFNINVISEGEGNLIDWIEFIDRENNNRLIAKLRASEIFPFLKYYSKCLIDNLNANRNSYNNGKETTI